MEVIERFFFDRIDGETARASIRRQHHPIAAALAHEAEAALAFVQAAITRAEIALDATIG